MKILAIDTSCDDTSIAILEIQARKKKLVFKTLSNIISSQVKLHQKYGGVYPSLAKREHQKNLIPVLKTTLKKSNILKLKVMLKVRFAKGGKSQKPRLQSKIQNLDRILEREPLLLRELKRFLLKYQKPKIDFIAVTVGPGLEPCLWQGINFAKALSFWWNIPLIPVNHIEAHILANWLKPIGEKSEILNPCLPAGRRKSEKIFPAIALVVSGGHTQLILMKKIGQYKILGETRDDAAGEAFDKIARILGLPYPGGPAIAEQAKKCSKTNNQLAIKLPRPMIYSKDYDLSFSGLKTAVLYDYKKRPKAIRESKEYIQAMAKEVQQAIIDVLIKKTIKAAIEYNAKTIILGGGVAANSELRKQLRAKIKKLKQRIQLFIPPKKLCTDNALMIAIAGYFSLPKNKTTHWQKLQAKANLRISH